MALSKTVQGRREDFIGPPGDLCGNYSAEKMAAAHAPPLTINHQVPDNATSEVSTYYHTQAWFGKRGGGEARNEHHQAPRQSREPARLQLFVHNNNNNKSPGRGSTRVRTRGVWSTSVDFSERSFVFIMMSKIVLYRVMCSTSSVTVLIVVRTTPSTFRYRYVAQRSAQHRTAASQRPTSHDEPNKDTRTRRLQQAQETMGYSYIPEPARVYLHNTTLSSCGQNKKLLCDYQILQCNKRRPTQYLHSMELLPSSST